MKKNIKNLTFQPGTKIYFEHEEFTILKPVDLEYLLAENSETGHVRRLKIVDITLTQDSPPDSSKKHYLDALTEKDIETAQKRLDIIRPLVGKPRRTKADVEAIAKEQDLHINTLYQWLRSYESEGLMSSLVPQIRSDSGSKKLEDNVEAIISGCIEEEYLTKQKKSIPHLYKEIKRQCTNAGLKCPHINTIRNRVNQLSDELGIRKRFGAKKSHELLHMNQGEIPHADYPLSEVQIDHTLLDIILVDDEHRLPLDRPWITLAIDVFSRMVVGFYVSFDPPGAVGVGACLSHAILPKELWLVDHDIDTSWPCWGIPRTVHADNAKEFRGKMLQLSCEQYGINLEWRPVARPHFGAHIERLLGTFAKHIHTLPGSTFSNTTQREGYNSEKNSALTLKEFEKWFAALVTQQYHNSYHTGIHTTPLKRYEEGVLGTHKTKGTGLPPRIQDEETLRLNFLPVVERTIQDYGIRIDNIYYYHDVLRVWINATEESQSKLKKKFKFRRDPRDISKVWFYDPQIESYFAIPYRNTKWPAVSIWEFNAALNRLKSEGKNAVDEDEIFAAIEKMRTIEKESIDKTKKARRAQQRRKSSHEKAIKVNKVLDENTEVNAQNIDASDMLEDDEIILPFDEMEEVLNND